MCISLVYFLCFIFEFISVAVLVFALTREVWFTFGGNFAIYGTIQGYGSLWKKCFRLIDQDLQMTCENTKPSSTPVFIYTTRTLLISACIVGGLCGVLLLKSWIHCQSTSSVDHASLREEDGRYYKCYSALLALSSLLQGALQIGALLLFAEQLSPEYEGLSVHLSNGFFFASAAPVPHLLICILALFLGVNCTCKCCRCFKCCRSSAEPSQV
ncbi:uncharacterized protein LOC134844507 [Symsagittifera roscoffensis]|uniref:uncharacterized protein LOC134844507 n=1 Tax=Symsagittifera roscoffensis TaxID=84072 RepID=UPI00307C3384